MINAIGFILFKILMVLLPLAGTVFLGWVAWKMWVHYIRQDFISGIEFVLLEIVPPREVLRSPKAMELFITNALYHWSNKGGKEEYWQGAVWFWFSLEIASIDGQVHFYIRTPSRIKGLIETQMYAQYPQAQVKVVEDYTLAVDEISPTSSWNGWGCEFNQLKPEAFPIRTYVDFGLDDDPDEELKVDPVSPIIELFGSLQKGEQAWLQYVITPSKKMYPDKDPNGKRIGWLKKHDWIAESRYQLLQALLPFTNTRENVVTGGYGTEVRAPRFMSSLEERVTTKTGKLGFETGVRLMYVAKKEIFNVGKRTNASRDIRLILRQFTAPDSNGFDRFNSSQGDAYGGIFTLSSKKVMKLAERMLHEYRNREFFHLPMRHHLFSEHMPWMHWPVSRVFLAYKHHATYVLNTEELATIWHFPGQISRVPTLTRIESKEASPPPNLPI